ncbi:MAG TPA: glycine betaine ABC transporter substrate-binding protein [Bacillales bacterium]
MKNLINIFFAAVLLLGVLAGCGSENSSGSGGSKEITIGAKNFTEQFLLSKMTVYLLEDAGFTVNEKSGMGSTALRKAMTNGQIDAVWDYSGTVLVTYLGKEPISDPEKAFQKVKEVDKKKNGIIWLNRSDVNNTYALVMEKKDADKLGIKSISDLAAYINENPGKLTFGTNAEFANRSDGLPGVEKTYGFEFGVENVKQMKTGLQYEAIHSDQIDVAMGFSTDSRIKKYDLVTLKDDKQFFPVYNAMFGANQDVYKKYPKLKEIMKPLAEKLNSDIMRNLNYQVDVKGKSVAVVAKNWLVENGLLEK